MDLQADLVFEISCDIGKELVIGNTDRGFLRVIPITGGTFSGKISGTIVPGGADWNTMMSNGVSHAFAKYTLLSGQHRSSRQIIRGSTGGFLMAFIPVP